jgi:glutathione synthase/RimK-type ligase-like ATP-grasp enzyme
MESKGQSFYTSVKNDKYVTYMLPLHEQIGAVYFDNAMAMMTNNDKSKLINFLRLYKLGN